MRRTRCVQTSFLRTWFKILNFTWKVVRNILKNNFLVINNRKIKVHAILSLISLRKNSWLIKRSKKCPNFQHVRVREHINRLKHQLNQIRIGENILYPSRYSQLSCHLWFISCLNLSPPVKMSLQWTLIAGFLYVEIAVVLLLVLPVASPRRWNAFFKSRFLQGLTNQAGVYFMILLAVLVLFLLDAIREMRKYANAGKYALHLRHMRI